MKQLIEEMFKQKDPLSLLKKQKKKVQASVQKAIEISTRTKRKEKGNWKGKPELGKGQIDFKTIK